MATNHKRKKKVLIAKDDSTNSSIDSSRITFKEDILRWIFSIVSSVLVYLVVAFIIQKTYHPDIKALLDLANKITYEGSARPEPVEALLFRCGVIIILPGMLFFYFLFSKNKMVEELAPQPFFLIFTTLCIVFIIAMIYMDFNAPNPFASGGSELPQNSRDYDAQTNFDFFFKGLFLGGNLIIYTFILVPIIASVFFIGFKKYKLRNYNSYKIGSSLVAYVAVGGIILSIILMDTFYFPYNFPNKYDFNAVYYSMTQVYAGIPLLVDRFTNTYGLYPHFLNPLFKVIGLSVFKFSLVMALLTGLSFYFNFYVLKTFVKNEIILVLGFLTVIFFPFLDFRLLTPFDSGFSLFPIRYIIPSTLALLTVVYLLKRSQIVYWITFILMGFFILWNPELGVVCYLSWLVVNTYNDFFTPQGTIAFRKICFHWLSGICVLIVVFGLYKFIIYSFYGSSPDLGLLFGNIILFGKVGFGLLPMSLIHPWNISALILISGFMFCIIKWFKKQITPKASVILLISLIALGFLTYFQGRSHNWTFASSSGFCLMLLVLLGDELWERNRDKNVFALNLMFVIFIYIISFSFFEIIFNIKSINELVHQENDRTQNLEENEHIKSNADFIFKNSDERRKIYVLSASQYQGLYFDGKKRLSAFNPGLIDMLLNIDVKRLENNMIDSSFNVFIEPALCKYAYLREPLAAMAASYQFKDSSQSMFLLAKRKIIIPPKAFFENSNSVVLKRKYTDDSNGSKLRINDALGIDSIVLNSEFSVEVLFNSSAQIYEYATLIGNMNDSSGFMIANTLHSPNYFFGINGKGVTLALPENEWVCCVINVYPDHVEIYENGNLAGQFQLAEPMRQSPEKMFIGNLGYFHHYIGAISEIAVINSVLDKKQIEETWDEIKNGISKP